MKLQTGLGHLGVKNAFISGKQKALCAGWKRTEVEMDSTKVCRFSQKFQEANDVIYYIPVESMRHMPLYFHR